MGCDIHATLDYDIYYDKLTKREGKANHHWYSFATNINIDRNYTLFTILAGVRNSDVRPIIALPRGLPEKPSWEFINELEKWEGDAHSTSYVTWSELRDWKPNLDSVKNYEWDVTSFREDDWYKVMKMLASKYGDDNVRLLFFFDN